MSPVRMWRILVYWGMLSAAVILGGEAILNAADKNAKNSICDSGICQCTSRGEIVVTCTCSATGTQDVDLQGTYQPHPNTNKFRIENCQRVTVNANTFANLQNLRRVELANIAEIYIKENAFSWKANDSLIHEPYPIHITPSGIIIEIVNSSIPNIPTYAFKGRLESIVMRNVQVGIVNAFAFTNLHGTLSLEFVNSSFNNLQAQAFKKFTVGSLTLSGGSYGSLPSRTMVDIEVIKTLLIEKLSAETVRSSAFIITGCDSLKIDGCRFTRVEGDAFRAVTRSPTYIQNSVFISLGPGAFAGITVDNYVFSTKKHQKLFFRGNNITHFEPGALVFNITRVDPQLDTITIEQPCSCNLTVPLTIAHRPSGSRTQNSDDSANIDSLVFSCRVDENNKSNYRYVTFQEYNQANCGSIYKTSKLSLVLIIIISSSLILLIIGVVMICICRRRRRLQNQTWKNVPTSNPTYEQDTRKFVKKNKKGTDSRITMVVPDGRMYRETELHVIVEQAEPIGDQHIYQNMPVAEPLIPAGQKPVPRPRTKLPNDK